MDAAEPEPPNRFTPASSRHGAAPLLRAGNVRVAALRGGCEAVLLAVGFAVTTLPVVGVSLQALAWLASAVVSGFVGFPISLIERWGIERRAGLGAVFGVTFAAGFVALCGSSVSSLYTRGMIEGGGSPARAVQQLGSVLGRWDWAVFAVYAASGAASYAVFVLLRVSGRGVVTQGVVLFLVGLIGSTCAVLLMPGFQIQPLEAIAMVAPNACGGALALPLSWKLADVLERRLFADSVLASSSERVG